VGLRGVAAIGRGVIREGRNRQGSKHHARKVKKSRQISAIRRDGKSLGKDLFVKTKKRGGRLPLFSARHGAKFKGGWIAKGKGTSKGKTSGGGEGIWLTEKGKDL